MALRADLVARCAPLLPSGSQVRQVFICQAAPNRGYFLITYLTGLAIFWVKYRCVAVTADAIYVLESSKPSGGAKPKSLVGTLPRQTQLGPMSGRWAPWTSSASVTGCTSASTRKSGTQITTRASHTPREVSATSTVLTIASSTRRRENSPTRKPGRSGLWE